MLKLLVPVIVILAMVLLKKKKEQKEQGKSNTKINMVAGVMMGVGLVGMIYALYMATM
ncbi:hypothetical protein [Bacillus sp. 166amftsu]|uniref:hypothetical protein n=1 Tax=Bacillus sp. 166amftsu TaxID=1761753 RepID=UPI000894B3E3|nr:hypothetical protein [Bacillus sp. 166amftsu]SDZ44681.1 hypothetical protein SAMN04488156_1465 [Bacillus sp. 166amftsu]